MSLVRAEARRLAKRRITRVMLALLVAGLALIAVSFSLTSKQIGADERAAAAAQAQAQYEENLRYSEQERAECDRLSAAERAERYGPGFECEFISPPPQEAFEAEWFLPYQFNFQDEFAVFITIFAGILAVFGFIVGASYVGAEWSTGGMTNLLLWRPRRLPVLLTKLGVLLGGVLATGVLLGALWTLAFWLIGKYDGVTGEMTAGVWQSFALTGARGLGLALAVAAVGFGLASIGRHTAMALGVAVALVGISEIALRIALNIAGVKFADRYALSSYAAAWFDKEYRLTDWNACNFSAGECLPDTYLVTWGQSAVVFGVGTALVLGATIWTMRSRDVT